MLWWSVSVRGSVTRLFGDRVSYHSSHRLLRVPEALHNDAHDAPHLNSIEESFYMEREICYYIEWFTGRWTNTYLSPRWLLTLLPLKTWIIMYVCHTYVLSTSLHYNYNLHLEWKQSLQSPWTQSWRGSVRPLVNYSYYGCSTYVLSTSLQYNLCLEWKQSLQSRWTQSWSGSVRPLVNYSNLRCTEYICMSPRWL
jgi:hypothetical protein